jgi:hypothetical protein
MRSQVVIVCGFVVACGSSLTSTQFRGPDGTTKWWSIACKGDNSLCLREAGEVCPHGYNTADHRSHDGSETNSVTSGGGYFPVMSSTKTNAVTNDELVIQCNGPGIAATTVEPECAKPPNLRTGAFDCPNDRDARRFLANDPREQGGTDAKTK